MTKPTEAQHRRETSFGFLIQLLGRRIDLDMRQKLADIGIDKKIFSNLMLLSEKDGITQRELGRHLEFPEYFTSRTVDDLVKMGFAERRPDPSSRRSILVYLTPRGREKAKELPAIVSGVNRKYETPLTAGEQKQLIQLLHKVAKIDHG